MEDMHLNIYKVFFTFHLILFFFSLHPITPTPTPQYGPSVLSGYSLIFYQGGKGAVSQQPGGVGKGLNRLLIHSAICGPTIISTSRGTRLPPDPERFYGWMNTLLWFSVFFIAALGFTSFTETFQFSEFHCCPLLSDFISPLGFIP